MNGTTKIAVGVIGSGVALMALMLDNLYESLATGVATLDRFPIRGRVIIYSFLNGVDPRVIMALFNNESKGNPAHYLGDVDASGGPSIGPGQVYRATAKALGIWRAPTGITVADERALYAQLASDEDFGISASIKVFKEKLRVAGGDTAKAIALYNGNPALPQVQKYKEKALAFLNDSYDLELA